MAKRTKSSVLQVGAASADVTPAMGIQLAGDIGRVREVNEIRERLYAHALVMQKGDTRFCFISLDLCVIQNKWADRIRRDVEARFGIPYDAVTVNLTQNHSAPSVGHLFVRDEWPLIPQAYPWLRGGDDRYNEPTVAAILDAVGRAVAAVQPVTLRAGRMTDGRVAFNRRFVMRDGSAVCHPQNSSPDILHVEGPTDPEVAVLLFDGADGKPVAAMLHHTCHPCHGYPTQYVIADWPGAWASEFLKRHSSPAKPAVALVANGCCGNIHHMNHLDPKGTQDHVRMAGLLAETTDTIMQKHLKPIAADEFAFRRSVLKLPMRQVPAKEVAAARKLVKANPEPMWLNKERTLVSWEWVFAVSLLDFHAQQQAQGTFNYEMQAVRIGDAALVTVMGEPFVEAQLKLKAGSPAPYTIVAHMCNGYAGYVPTADALKRGGFETRTSNGSKFGPEAVDAIANHGVKMLKRLF
ncbi:MAG: neutral/alkaline non-lysosomal ceramidase N-terminal domain-containing protein [Planctomycetota bacterium]|nr:neutral/alkaline non-lysosomal ceramidase N-terminal domain-containing protein [Planctomycetota bacterium]